MSDKLFTAKEAALAVLKKAEEVLKKSEVLKKYETEMSSKLGYKPSELLHQEKNIGPAKKEQEVEKGKKVGDLPGKRSKASHSPSEIYKGEEKRLEHQPAPGNNPKEKAEGNNQEWGSDPGQVAKAEGKMSDRDADDDENPDEKADAELGEDVEHLVEDHAEENQEAEAKEGHRLLGKKIKKSEFEDLYEDLGKLGEQFYPEELEKSEDLKKKYYGFKAVEEKARKSGARNPAAVAAAAGRKKYGKEAFQHAAAKGKKMGKAEEMRKDAPPAGPKLDSSKVKAFQQGSIFNPSGAPVAKADSKKDYPQDLASENIREHMRHRGEHPGGRKQAIAIGIEQARRGEHEAKAEDPMSAQAFVPAKSIGSAKLAKFMERVHAKRKARGSK